MHAMCRAPSGTGRNACLQITSQNCWLCSAVAIAGVQQHLWVYDYASLASSTAGAPAPGPSLDLATRHKLSCLSFNPQRTQHLLSSDYEGQVCTGGGHSLLACSVRCVGERGHKSSWVVGEHYAGLLHNASH